MYFVTSEAAIRAKYGSAAQEILTAVSQLGDVVDVSGKSPNDIQIAVGLLPANAAVCLVGGYDVVAPFIRPNPTHGSQDDDLEIPTDAPYGATPGNRAQEYAPTRAVCRIPDGATADASAFLSILGHQAVAPTAATPTGSYEEAAKEFSGASKYVHAAIPHSTGAPVLSPPATHEDPSLTSSITGRGRIHILLHGASYDPDWAYLWGHDGSPHSPFIKALSAALLDLCDLRASLVTFSSCYAAMLDTAPATSGARTTRNQVSLACLSHGAKAVYAATRSNWIDTGAKADGFGPGLVAEVWKQLAARKPAAEALRLAKWSYLKSALSGSPADRPYAYKTVLQAHCYGHPAAVL